MNYKVLIVLIFFHFCENVSTKNNPTQLNRLTKTPPNVSLYRYEGNLYPFFGSKKLNELQGNPNPRYTRYLNPVYLSHQIYHQANDDNQAKPNDGDDDATGSEYQVAMKVQPLQQVISNGKPQRIEESGKSEDERKLKIDTMSLEKKQALRNTPNGFYNHKNNELRMESVPNKIDSFNRYYHDIFMKYKSPQELVFGHVLSWPEEAQRRLEKRDNKNNFKGQVIWADRTGGYGEHYWDLAQGAL